MPTGFAFDWDILGGVLRLQAAPFSRIPATPATLFPALTIVLLAGLSLELGQVIILFVSRVRPVRFVFSLLINAILYTVGYGFLVLSTWLLCGWLWSISIPLETLAAVLGWSYGPLLFSFLGALPYLGVPLLSLLSVWHLLAMVVGFAAIAQTSLVLAFGHVALGWVVLQVGQRTVGYPIAQAGQWIANTTAGTELAPPSETLADLMEYRLRHPLSLFIPAYTRQLARTARRRVGDALAVLQSQGRQTAERWAMDMATSGAARSQPASPAQSWGWLALVLSLGGMVLLTGLIAFSLEPLRQQLLGWNTDGPQLLHLVLDLIWVGIVAIAVAGLLAPLETLSWWAGWYDDAVDDPPGVGILAEPIDDPQHIDRYAIYLDGVGQASPHYTPDIETFLATLLPRLPDHVALIRGLVTYSAVNHPLDQARPLAWLWQLADRARLGNPASVLGFLVNLRNVLIVFVSADRRYGPLYNYGIARMMYTALVNQGYQPGEGRPITLIGYSGGAQMAAAAAPLLKRVTGAPVTIISLGGVISGNCNLLTLKHLYHLVGENDRVEQLGAILFPGRWRWFPLSRWNQAQRLGKISRISLGPLHHQEMLDPNAHWPDGRSYLQATVDWIIPLLTHPVAESAAAPDAVR